MLLSLIHALLGDAPRALAFGQHVNYFDGQAATARYDGVVVGADGDSAIVDWSHGGQSRVDSRFLVEIVA